jgi:helicase required for RNAi-mediated heterochromatin assembly 1
MDNSQMAACERMLTSRVAIIQGPPGTGKTFTSVSNLKVMIQNWHPGDPPIVVSAQTNHALDQLLNHVLAFEPNILRLGGRSNKANKEILKRTLYSLRKDNEIPGSRIGFRHCTIQLNTCKANIMAALETLTTENLLSGETLMKNGLITECQYKSLHASSNWDGAGSSNDIAECKIIHWAAPLVLELICAIGLTEDQIMPVPETAPFNLGLEVEHADIEEEEVENIENEFKTDAVDEATEVEEEDKDGLVGDLLLFTRKCTGRHSNPPTLSKIKQKLASWKNLYDVPLAQRGELYRFFEKAMNKLVLKVLKARLKEYQEAVNTWNVTRVRFNPPKERHRLGSTLT